MSKYKSDEKKNHALFVLFLESLDLAQKKATRRQLLGQIKTGGQLTACKGKT